MDTAPLGGGFESPPQDAAKAFRQIMEAMARPGNIRELRGAAPPPPMSPAAAAVLLTLCDTDTPLHLAGDMDCADVRTWISFHTGAPLTGPFDCMFALGTWSALGSLEAYPKGTSEYPDRSATLIVEMPGLEARGAILSGPGIEEAATLSLPETKAFRANRMQFPLGCDFIFTCGNRLAALPRSTEIA